MLLCFRFQAFFVKNEISEKSSFYLNSQFQAAVVVFSFFLALGIFH